MTKNILCSTLDIRDRGGVLSMIQAFHDAFDDDGYSIKYVFPSRDRSDHITLRKSLKFNFTRFNNIFNFSGLNCCSFSTFLPEFEFLHYITAKRFYREIMKQHSVFISISGFNHAALPFAVAKKPFLLWIASSYREDREDRVKRFPIKGKIFDIFSSPIVEYYEGFIFSRASSIAVLSNYTKKMILKKYPKIKPDSIDVIYYPIDLNFWKPMVLSKPSKERCVIFVGRFNDPRKNVEMLLKAFSIVCAKQNFIRLKIVGGNTTPKIQNLCEILNIKDKVDFYDFLPKEKIFYLLNQSDFFVLPSFQEGLCIAAIEAMACGLPVVSTYCGGPEDFVIHNETGILVENDNAEALADAILNLLQNDSMLKHLTEKSIDMIRSNFSKEVFKNKFENIFQKSYPELYKA
jgi:glycosyltransferase involved in cell wall biosynthesis